VADPRHDDELRSAFQTFRADALDAMAAPDVEALKETARHRQHSQRMLGGVAAVVLLLVGAGAAMVTTHTPPIGQRGVSDASSHANQRSTATPAPTQDSLGGPQTGQSASASASASAPGKWDMTLAVPKSEVPLAPKDSSHYTGKLSVRLANTGSESIPRTAVELTMPTGVSYAGSDGSACGAGRTCRVATLTDLAPGDTYTVNGTLTYQGANPPANVTVDATVQAVASGTDGTELTTTSQDFTVSVGDGASPSPSPSPSESPSSNPSEAPTSGSDGTTTG
jgi:hypothetical protein